MSVPAPNPLAVALAEGLERYRARLAGDFGAIWQRVCAQAGQAAPVARLWNVYNEGYLLRRAGPAVPLLAIDLIATKQVDSQERQAMLDSLPDLAGLLITHRHSDHMDADVIRRALAAGAPVALPGHAWEGLREQLGVDEPPPGLRIVRAGDAFDTGGVSVRVHASDHQSKNVGESLAYEVRVDGLTILAAADHRAFDAPVETWPRGADLLILSVYHSELDAVDAGELAIPGLQGMTSDESWLARFRWDQHPQLLDLAERLAPRVLLLGHLYELSHETEKLWRFLDTGLIREALFARAPEIAVGTLAPGECLPLLPPAS